MEDNNIEIIDDNSETKVETNNSTDVVMPELKTDAVLEPQVIDTKIDKKELKKQEKQKKLEEKKIKEEKTDEPTPDEESSEVTIVETAITKGAAGSQVIGSIDGDTAVANNNPLPGPIDINVKQKNDNKSKTKKVKVVSKKEKIFSILISIFVILVIGGAGFAIYYFGYKTNPGLYSLKNIYLELGDHLPNTVSYYVQSSNQFDDMEYNLDISKVQENVIGTYTYTVSHKKVTKTAQVIVRDTKAPTLTVKEKEKLLFQKNAKVDKDDIVVSCEDLSNCTYKTEYEINTETPGEKEIKIIARDDVGNETTETVTIKIIDIQKTLVCTSSDINSEDNKYKNNDIYTLYFDGNDYLVRQSGIKLYTYSDYEAYFEKLAELQNDSNYNFNRTNFTYSESTEVKTNNLTNLNDLVNYYNENGFTCK